MLKKMLRNVNSIIKDFVQCNREKYELNIVAFRLFKEGFENG